MKPKHKLLLVALIVMAVTYAVVTYGPIIDAVLKFI